MAGDSENSSLHTTNASILQTHDHQVEDIPMNLIAILQTHDHQAEEMPMYLNDWSMHPSHHMLK